MSRVAPTSGSKALYFLCIALSSFLVYLDINYKSFERAKNLYKSFTISSSYLFKRVTIDPFNYIFEISKEKSKLIEENKKLKQELDNSFITNFIISRDSKFFANDAAIKNLKKEGFDDFNCKIIKSGDVMLDGAIFYKDLAVKPV